jgi:hypothetical protein
MLSRTLKFSLVLLVLASLFSPVQAQVDTRPRGVVLSGGLIAAGLTIKDAGMIDWYGGETYSAAGLHLAIGYAFPAGISIHVGGSGAGPYTDQDGDKFTAGLGELSARYMFGAPRSALRPFLDLGLGFLLLDYNDLDLELSGGHISAGGGVAYFVRPFLALDAAVRVGTGNITDIKADRVTLELEDEDRPRATAAHLALGLRWYPRTRTVLAREK